MVADMPFGFVRVGPEGIEGWYRVGGAIEIVFDPF